MYKYIILVRYTTKTVEFSFFGFVFYIKLLIWTWFHSCRRTLVKVHRNPSRDSGNNVRPKIYVFPCSLPDYVSTNCPSEYSLKWKWRCIINRKELPKKCIWLKDLYSKIQRDLFKNISIKNFRLNPSLVLVCRSCLLRVYGKWRCVCIGGVMVIGPGFTI